MVSVKPKTLKLVFVALATAASIVGIIPGVTNQRSVMQLHNFLFFILFFAVIYFVAEVMHPTTL
jgi:hypothetical protein